MTTQSQDPSPAPSRIATRAREYTRDIERWIRGHLTWNRLYHATSYIRSALWIVPLFAIVLVLALAPLLRALDGWLGWRLTGLGVAGAQSLHDTVITLTLSFLVFTFGSLLVAIQIAGGQLTPRIIATTLLRDNVVRYSVGLFVFALVFAVMARDRIETRVYDLVAFVTAILGIACMATFLFLIDYAARLLRPVSILARVGNEGLAVIKAVYPRAAGQEDATDAGVAHAPDTPRRTVPYTGNSGIVLAVDVETLVREADWAGGVIELMPQVGDFVATDEPLFVLFGGATTIPDRVLRTTVALGPERTMEQDPLFSFRILVDIALKALSPAINDPTTAVLSLDQIHRLLRFVGKRRLHGMIVADSQGQARVICRTPNWEHFVHLSCTEIRACGAGQVQVARRMRAMFDNLVTALPPHRHEAIERERTRLDQALESLYPISDDLALARLPDSQGLGGGIRRAP